jgi:ferredoxin-NADP reductase
MARYDTRLLAKALVAEGTMSFSLARPAGFEFTAGQFITLTFPGAPYQDSKGNKRTFSIASAPQERDRLMVATRLTGSAFKRSLAEAAIGTELVVGGPGGSFSLPKDAESAFVLVAGGIGITPFRSILFDAAARGLAARLTLHYSNRLPSGAAFHEELRRLAAENHRFEYLPTVTEAEPPVWNGERRPITAERLVPADPAQMPQKYLIAGPPGLVIAVREGLRKLVPPDRVVDEAFEGYATSAPPAAAPARAATAFTAVATTGQIAPGRMLGAVVNGRSIVVVNLAGTFHALAGDCPHAGGHLVEGEIIGKTLTCPVHGAVFDIPTGAVLEPPADTDLDTYEVRVVGDTVEVAI